jgi:hypothetical protein
MTRTGIVVPLLWLLGCGRIEAHTDAGDVGDDAIDAEVTIDAVPPPPVMLTVATTGTGTVQVSPPGDPCGPGCSIHGEGDEVTLTADPGDGYLVTSWSAGCTGTIGVDCDLTITADTTINVGFDVAVPVDYFHSQTIETYAVPPGATALHVIARGASGGSATTTAGVPHPGGFGAIVDVVVPITGGSTVSIVVGGQPDNNVPGMDGCGASGGGGSFVAVGNTALVVAGGGGGASAYSVFTGPGGDASLTADGGDSGIVQGGTAGGGGGNVGFEGSGGGGFSGNGLDSTPGQPETSTGGGAFLNGAAGGVRATTESCGTLGGGYGGGGGGGDDLGGGGGGYSGGAAQDSNGKQVSRSGGGGSYAIAAGSIQLRPDHGHGVVRIIPQ